jgi:hypothetical protein
MFKSTSNKGFQITFANGYTVSVQWGNGNYCEKKQYGGYGEEMKHQVWESPNAEVAVWDKNGDWVRPAGINDDVKGYQTPEEVAEIIEKVSKWQTK